MNEFKTEEILKTISGWVLFLGICLSLIAFFTTAVIRDPQYTYIDSYIFSWSGLIPTLGYLITSIATQQFLLVISEISRSLKKIKKEISESN
jgi:hypothetical protein